MYFGGSAAHIQLYFVVRFSAVIKKRLSNKHLYVLTRVCDVLVLTVWLLHLANTSIGPPVPTSAALLVILLRAMSVTERCSSEAHCSQSRPPTPAAVFLRV